MAHDANMVLTCVFSIHGQSSTFTHVALHSLQPLLDFFGPCNCCLQLCLNKFQVGLLEALTNLIVIRGILSYF
jgi:hypothetical protein